MSLGKVSVHRVGVLGVVVIAMGTFAHAQESEQKEATEVAVEGPDGSNAGAEAEVDQVPDEEKAKQASTAVARMKTILSKVIKYLSEARDENDVVKVNCLNEKLTAIKGLLNVAEKAEVKVADAVARRDTGDAAHEFDKVMVAKSKTEQMLSESEACVGELAVYSGDTDIQTEVDEDIAGAPDASSVVFVGDTGSPYRADPDAVGEDGEPTYDEPPQEPSSTASVPNAPDLARPPPVSPFS